MPVGLLGEHRNVIAGRRSASTRRDLVHVEREVVGALAHRPPVPVMRAMWLCRA